PWRLERTAAHCDALLKSLDESGHGLANQGWKGSGDSIRFADGSLASGAIALAEVQGYAYAAALHAAELLEDPALRCTAPSVPRSAVSLPQQLRDWAAALK